MLTQTACDEPSKEHEDGSSCGPEDNLFDRQRRHTPPERRFTCHFLFLLLDTSPDSQSWRPPWKSTKTTVYERLDPKRAIHWVVNLIFTTTETHKNAQAPTTCIQNSNIYDLKLASQTYHFNNAKPPTTFGYLTLTARTSHIILTSLANYF